MFQKNCVTFPETIVLDTDDEMNDVTPCVSMKVFTYVMNIVSSRAFFVEDALRLIPILYMANTFELHSK